MNDVYGRRMPPSPYKRNETMELLGKQTFKNYFGAIKEARKGLDEIKEARPHSFTKDAAEDIFVLGYIYGKRADRARRASRTNKGEI